jgi:SNF2 family DNA or RNA helicase
MITSGQIVNGMKTQVMLISLKAGALGLNLTVRSYLPRH